jgi:apolipoprotein N-acyltransferase
MKKLHPFLLSSLSGLLLFAAWPASPLTFLIFIAFIPLLWLEQQGILRRKFFGWAYITMLVWNASTTWWIWNASAPGAVGAILANSLIMCLPWLGFHFVKSRMGSKWGYSSLVMLWLTFEYIHLQDWGLSWPWLTLGNVFAGHPGWVQWYSITGTSGGSLWILGVNVLTFRLLAKLPARPFPKRSLILPIAALLLPLIISFLLYPIDLRTALPASAKTNVVIVQPNIDPYEKLTTGSFEAMIHKLIRLSDSVIDDNTALVVWPETALYMENGISEDNMKANYFLDPLWDFLRRHPQIDLLSGVESYRAYQGGQQSSTARNIPNTNIYIDSYNAAIIFDSTGPLHSYHKSKLVPGVETLPSFLHFLDPVFDKFGGTTAGYTGQSDRTPLSTSNHSYTIAPAVCYESIYGEFMSNYVRNGADIIAIITNDGWWGNTPGYTQHEYYARLRAIETRRWVVRSANTGVSCIIAPTGNIIEARPWFQPAVIKSVVPPLQEKTFYVKYGDLISRLAIFATVLLTACVTIQIIKRKRSRG